MKVLTFNFRGQQYLVNKAGEIKANGLKEYSSTWIFLGGSNHHWCSRVSFTLKDAFKHPHLLNGCLGWDIDHGTTRRWGGLYYGRLPRIENTHIINN